MLSKRLKALRQENNLLQKDIAKKLNISTSAYGFYEQGKRTPDLETVLKLAEIFDVTIDYLLGRNDIKTPIRNGKYTIETKINNHLNLEGLPNEAVKEIENYIKYIKTKYSHNETLKDK